jgi:hypothetical protein
LLGRSPVARFASCEKWIELHRDELEANWDRAVGYQEPHPIEPLR